MDVAEYRMANELGQEVKLETEEQLGKVCGKSVDVFESPCNCKELQSLDGKELILGKVASGNEICRAASVVAKKANVSDLCCGEEVIARLEADFRNVQDKLTLKNAQFNHLEEAHEKLRSEFQSSKLEWEKERLIVHGNITSLQSSLDSHRRISDCLETKLKMSNQALAHEESRRKLVEVQLSESQALFENIYAKCQDDQAKIDKLNTQKDEEIASLKYLLATKDVLFKEMEYKKHELEKQNDHMLISLKEFQEAETKHYASFQSLTKLQQKFEILEQVHNSCSTNVELKEMEWTSQFERLKAEAMEYLSEVSNKEEEICDLRKELEMSQFSVQRLNEEMDVVRMLLKAEYAEAYSKLLGELKNSQNQIFLLTKDLEDSKNKLEESQRMQRQIEEHVLEVENINKVDLTEKTREINFLNAELQKWKNDAENMKSSLVEAEEIHELTEGCIQLQLENVQACKHEIESLKYVVREHERNIDVLQQQVTSLESVLVVKDDTIEDLELKNKSYISIIEELESKNIYLSENISGIVFDWQNILGEMEGASKQLHEICCYDEGLLAAFRNPGYASVESEQKLCSEISSHDERNEAILFSPTATKLQMLTNE